MRQLSDCHANFRAQIRAIAEENEKTPEFVYGLWLMYCQACQDFDQSPVLFEFKNWNAKALADPIGRTCPDCGKATGDSTHVDGCCESCVGARLLALTE